MSETDADVLTAIRRRRVVRHFTDQPISRDHMRAVLSAARWAPSGGNRRLHRFVAVRDPVTIKLIRAMSPGMAAHPTALTVICIDWGRALSTGCKRGDPTIHIDVGTAAENMLLAAHQLGLGAGPVTSFSMEAVAALLGLPGSLAPTLIVYLGHPAPRESSHQTLTDRPTTLRNLVIWERYGPRAG